MKSASLKEIKSFAEGLSSQELVSLLLRLGRFKKENKELLTYLLFESDDEGAYVSGVTIEIDELFNDVNTSSLFFAKKTIRKIVRVTNRYIKYSEKETTEVELLIYVCMKIKELPIDIHKSMSMLNLYNGLLKKINKSLQKMHEDLQYDYKRQVLQLEL